MFLNIFRFEIIFCQTFLELGNSKNRRKTAKKWDFFWENSKIESLQRYHIECTNVGVELTVCPSQKIPQVVLCLIFVSNVVMKKQSFFVPDLVKKIPDFSWKFKKFLISRKNHYISGNSVGVVKRMLRFGPTPLF